MLAPLCLLLAACTGLLPGNERLRDAEPEPAPSVDAGEPDAFTPDAAVEGASTPDAASPPDAGDVPCPDPTLRERRVLENVELEGDTHWGCDVDYEIEGYVVITQGTLRIDPGVRVLGRINAVLVIGRNARIEALGTADQPIVMSAAERPAKPEAWRGLVLLGRAETSLRRDAALGLPGNDERAFFGGDEDYHDCGQLRFVRIEFAGGPTDEYDFPGAGLTLAGCGRTTSIEYVQVHAATDGIGIVGGRVPLKRVLVSAPSADGIEWTAGYTGLIQFAIVQTFYGAGAALKGSRYADQTTLPASFPNVFNVTLVGAPSAGLPRGASDPNGFETGLQLQGGTRGFVRNSIVYGFAGPWLDVIGEATAPLVGGDLQVTNTIFAEPEARATPGFPGAGVEPGDGEDDDANLSEDQTFRQPSLMNRFPGAGFVLAGPYARPPDRPDFSADGFVDTSNLADTGPAGWEEIWEVAAYAGALPKLQFEADRALDWTDQAMGPGGSPWTAFPQE